MHGMFNQAISFYYDISKWDMSRVEDMCDTLGRAADFNGVLFVWAVSRVTQMTKMFAGASKFNGDFFKWDVSGVVNLDYMFLGARSFRGKLCGPAWMHSKTNRQSMFAGSSGFASISQTV